jgi:hypothetical protein
MRAAVTEDKALRGRNLSAGDGPKLAGAVSWFPYFAAAPSGVCGGVPLPSRLHMAWINVAMAVRIAGILSMIAFIVSEFIRFFSFLFSYLQSGGVGLRASFPCLSFRQ